MSSTATRRERLACLVVAHNLGDAVIQAGFFQKLIAGGYAERYLVWTRPQVAFLFENLPDCEVVCSQFPIGTSKKMGGRAVVDFIAAAWKVRRRKPSVSIDLIGDLRDRIFAHVAGTPRHLYIGWAEGHPFKRLIRNPFGEGKPFVRVSAEVPNVYEAHDVMLHALIPKDLPSGEAKVRKPRVQGLLRVGLHPFASQEFRLWPDASWQQLTAELLARGGVELSAFGAPTERERLKLIFASFGSGVRVITSDLVTFADEVSKLDVLVGLDSFSVHVAQWQEVRSVMLNAGQPPALWAPPAAFVLAQSGGCPHYPCFNIPKCGGSENPYSCIRSVEPGDVAAAVVKLASNQLLD